MAVLSQEAVGVLVGSPLPRTLRIAEVDIDVGRQSKAPVIRQFLAPVPGQRFVELGWQLLRLLDKRGNNGIGFLIGNQTLSGVWLRSMTVPTGGNRY